jgi:hypothetical protein
MRMSRVPSGNVDIDAASRSVTAAIRLRSSTVTGTRSAGSAHAEKSGRCG